MAGENSIDRNLWEYKMKQVFIHGLGQTANSWDKTISGLKNKENILCPNLADLVQTGEANYGNLFSNFSDLCNQSDKPIDVCGLSLGSVLALNYAIEYPNRVRSLILIAPQYRMPKKILQFQNIIFSFMPKSMFKTTGFNKADFIQLCKSMMKLDFSCSISKITCPVLVIYGEKDTANKKAAIELSRKLKNGVLKVITHSGHEVNIDTPKRLAKLICAFYDHIS